MQGLSAGSNFLNRIGEAILRARVLVFLLSPISATSRYCRDEVAMAYMSDKPIFPACLGSFDELSALLHAGMRPPPACACARECARARSNLEA